MVEGRRHLSIVPKSFGNQTLSPCRGLLLALKIFSFAKHSEKFCHLYSSQYRLDSVFKTLD